MDAVREYYEAATGYREALQKAWSAYLSGYENLKRYEGGKEYETDLAKLQDKRDEAIKAAKDKAASAFEHVLGYMRKAVASAPIEAPTDAQMAILSALKMREAVEPDELVKAAEQMRGVDLCVKVLAEIAAKNGHPTIVDEYMGAAGRAERAVGELTTSARLMLDLNRPDSIEQRHLAHHYVKFGGEFDPKHEGVEALGRSSSYALSAVDRDFADEREMMHELGNVAEGGFTEFRSIVNRNPYVKADAQKAWGEI